MEREISRSIELRPVISWAIILCLAVAAAPWLSGGQEPIGLLVSAFALLMAVVLLGRQPEVRRFTLGPVALLYAALVGWTALSLIWTVNRYDTMLWLVELLLAGVAFRLAYAVAAEVTGRVRLATVFITSVGLFCIYGIYLYLSGGYDRLTGPFYWPNPAAAYLIPALWLVYDRWRRGGEWWLAALGVLIGASFVLADSRGAIVAAVVSIIVYMLCIKLTKRFWITFVFMLVASIGVGFGLVWVRHVLQPSATVSTPGSRLAPAAAGNLQSGADRLKYLESTLAIVADHPWLGTGAGTFSDVHPAYQGRVISASTSAHNVYAQTLAELGILGALLLVCLVVGLLMGVLRGLWARPLGLAAAAGMGALWLHFGLDIDAQYPALVLLVAVMSGALYYQWPRYAPLGWRWQVVAALAIVPVMGQYISNTWTVRAQSAQSDGDYQLAVVDYEHAHNFGIYNPDVLSAEGINEYTLAEIGTTGAAAKALSLARAAQRQDPDDAQHHQLEGLILDYQKKPQLAMAAFRRALELDPYNHPEYSYDLAITQTEVGDMAGALKTAEQMLDQYPPGVVNNRAADPQIRAHLAQLAVMVGTIHLQAGDIVAARAASRQALKFDPGDVRAQAFATVLKRL